MVQVQINDHSMYLDGYLKKNLDKIKKAIRDDWDFVIVVDGIEGSGKSTMAIQAAYYLDPGFKVDKCCFEPEEFEKLITTSKKYNAIIYDEAITGFYSRQTMQYVNVTLTKLLAQIRQKNLFVFIVIPSFFDLDKYVAVWRSRALFHVYTKGFTRGYFSFFNSNSKKDLYIDGNKRYNYFVKKPDFRGRFTKLNPFYEEYEKKKFESLAKREQYQLDPFRQRDQTIKRLFEKGFKQREIGELMGLKQNTISYILNKGTL